MFPDFLKNTETGTKLILKNEIDKSLVVYSLPGKIPSQPSVDTLYLSDTAVIANTILVSITDKEHQILAIEENGSLQVKLYPNPTEQFINVSSDISFELIAIYSLDGILEKEEDINDTTGQIDLSGLNAGAYIVKIHTAHGVINKQIVLTE